MPSSIQGDATPVRRVDEIEMIASVVTGRVDVVTVVDSIHKTPNQKRIQTATTSCNNRGI